MELDFLLHFLLEESAFTLFLLLTCGYVLGNLRIFGFQPGSVAGVLFVSLFFGYLGFKIGPGAQSVGFALFIFSIVSREAKSSAPALGYTGTYAFANIILSMAGTQMVLL